MTIFHKRIKQESKIKEGSSEEGNQNVNRTNVRQQEKEYIPDQKITWK